MEELTRLKPKRNPEKYRFDISAESLLMMKESRELFKKLQEKFPEVLAMSFFGSRIRGQERKEKKRVEIHSEDFGSYEAIKMPSDLDVIVFYSLDSLPLNKNPGKQYLIGIFMREMNQIEEEIRKQEHLFGCSLHHTGIDVSKRGTERNLASFKRETDAGIKTEFFHLKGGSSFALATRFLLSVGDIYPVREAVFQAFEDDPNGEIYWQNLVRILGLLERPIKTHQDELSPPPQYKYPQTLAEGRKYFLTNKKVEPK